MVFLNIGYNSQIGETLKKQIMTKEKRKIGIEKRDFLVYNQITALLSSLNITLFMLDLATVKSFYKREIKHTGNLLKKAIESTYTGIFTGTSKESAEQYSAAADYLIAQSSIYTAIKTQDDDKALAFFTELEELYIRHGLLEKKGDLLQGEHDLETAMNGVV